MSRLVCVTGGAGYIGVHLVEQLVARGERVRVLDRFFWGTVGLDHLPHEVDLVQRREPHRLVDVLGRRGRG